MRVRVLRTLEPSVLLSQGAGVLKMDGQAISAHDLFKAVFRESPYPSSGRSLDDLYLLSTAIKLFARNILSSTYIHAKPVGFSGEGEKGAGIHA